MTIDLKKNIVNYRKKTLEQLDIIALLGEQNLKLKKQAINLKEIHTTDLSVFELKNVLYLFVIRDWGDVKNGGELCSAISILKADKSNPKLPKVNTPQGKNILYLGKSTGNFKTRLKQHLGGYSHSTYSLQLSSWTDKLKTMKIDLYYTQVDFNTAKNHNTNDLLELLETALHLEHQPLLGRSGH